jgi:N-acetylneuraminic acid mutarotase
MQTATLDATVCRCRSTGAAAAPSATGTFHLFFSLPEEMSLHVLSFLSAQDMCNIAKTSRELRRFSKENILWKKLCKRQGWVVPRCTQSDCEFFDFKKYYAEKLYLSKPGCMKWCESKATGAVPSKRFKHTATTVGNQIAFIGGQETDTKRFNDVVMFDAATEAFTAATIKGDKVPNFSRQTSCLVNGKVFVFGGFDGYGTNFDLAIMDPHARTWRSVPNSMVRGCPPPSRTNHAAASVGSKMFVFGGNNNNEAGVYQVLDDLHALDTETMTWSRPETTGCRPCARSGHSLTAIGHKLFLFGGGVWNERQGWVEKFNDVYVLDTHTMNWTKPQCSGTVETSTFPITFAVGRYLFVFGGGSRPKHCVTNDLHILDTATYTWSMPQVEGVKPQPRDMGTACVVGNAVYLFGGYAGGAVDYFDKLVLECPPLFE